MDTKIPHKILVSQIQQYEKKNTTPQPSGVYPGNAKLVQCLEISQYNPPY